MKLRSIGALAATIGLAAVAAPASAALIVNPIQTGPFSQADPLGTIMAIPLSSSNTYDFTFTMAQAASVLTEVAASISGPTSEPIEYSIWAGPPGGGVLIDTSTDSIGPSLTDSLGVGAYYLQVDVISGNGELMAGGLEVLPIPEPEAWGLMLVGIAGLGATMRFMRRRPAALTA